MCLTQADPPSRTEVEIKSLAESHGSRLNVIVTKSHVLGYSCFISICYINYSWILFFLSLQIIKCDADCVFAFKMEAPGLGC